jgi:hypothetical protein
MQQTKLIELMKHLDAKELTRFVDYVHSPFYNKHKEVKRLCTYLCKYIQDTRKQHKLEKERVYKSVYPNTPFDNTKLHGISSKLLSLLQDYLVAISQEDNKVVHLVKILGELRQRNQQKDYDAVLRKVNKIIENQQDKIEDKYWVKYLYHRELDVRFLTGGGRSYDSNLQAKSDFLDLFFIIKKLKIACDMVSRNKVIGSDYAYHLINELFSYLENPATPYAQEPSIKVYVAILKLLVHWKEDGYYPVVKELIGTYHSIFSKKELGEIYDFCLNYCIWRHNLDTNKDNHHLKEMLQIYKLTVREHLIFIDGYLPPWEYKTIVTTGISLGEYEWTESFIEEYKSYLAPAIRTSAYLYNLGFFLYSQQDYKGALQALYEVVFTNWTYYVGAKMIQLRSYYELDEGEALYALIESFKTYLKRNAKVTDAHKIPYLNFVQLLLKIYKLKEKRDYIKVVKYNREWNKLLELYQQRSLIAARSWLQKIIKELEPDEIELRD